MRRVLKNRIYKHFKGNSYIVLDVGYDCETVKRCVIYRQLYGDGKIWIRDESDFLSEIDHNKYPNVKQKYRFSLQSIKSINKS